MWHPSGQTKWLKSDLAVLCPAFSLLAVPLPVGVTCCETTCIILSLVLPCLSDCHLSSFLFCLSSVKSAFPRAQLSILEEDLVSVFICCFSAPCSNGAPSVSAATQVSPSALTAFFPLLSLKLHSLYDFTLCATLSQTRWFSTLTGFPTLFSSYLLLNFQRLHFVLADMKPSLPEYPHSVLDLPHFQMNLSIPEFVKAHATS